MNLITFDVLLTSIDQDLMSNLRTTPMIMKNGRQCKAHDKCNQEIALSVVEVLCDA